MDTAKTPELNLNYTYVRRIINIFSDFGAVLVSILGLTINLI